MVACRAWPQRGPRDAHPRGAARAGYQGGARQGVRAMRRQDRPAAAAAYVWSQCLSTMFPRHDGQDPADGPTEL
jgi:hypothetical protein